MQPADAPYDGFADTFAREAARSPCNAHYDSPTVLGLLGNANGLRMPDCGCGPCLYLSELAARGAEPLTWAADARFDIVLLALVLHYAHDRVHALTEIAFILRPGARIITPGHVHPYLPEHSEKYAAHAELRVAVHLPSVVAERHPDVGGERVPDSGAEHGSSPIGIYAIHWIDSWILLQSEVAGSPCSHPLARCAMMIWIGKLFVSKPGPAVDCCVEILGGQAPFVVFSSSPYPGKTVCHQLHILPWIGWLPSLLAD
ncbi:hypothetical protein SAVIM40S_02347 [Streptomyces avidinii]